MEINISENYVNTRQIMSKYIVPMLGCPFGFRKDEAYDALKRSIEQFGLLEPITVKEPERYEKDPCDGNYQIISGRRRYEACKELGIIDIPARVLRVSQDDALIAMIDMNLCQRSDIPPSEKGKAYKLRLDVMKRQGYRSDLEADGTLSQVGTKLNSGEKLSEEVPDSRTQIYRYIRLTELIPELQQVVDDHRIALGPAVELSYLPEKMQKAVYDYYAENEVTPSFSQANQMKKSAAAGTLTPDVLTEILEQPKPNQVETIKIPLDDVRKYRPNYSVRQLQDFIRKACEHYAKYLRSRDKSAR